MVPMRDGVELRTIISLPGDGSYPTVLTRGYSAAGLSNHAGRFHKAGYAMVTQQCRGGGGSDGTRFFPDGEALNVTEGIVRARFRHSIWDAPSPIEPGKIYEYKIELLPIVIVFRKGHRIRVRISSSSWPLWDRNQNTGIPIGIDAETVVVE